MNLKIQLTSTILLFLMNSCSCQKEIYKSKKEKFINLAAVSNYVFIGGNQTIILLDASLNFLNSQIVENSNPKTQYPINWLMIMYGNIIVVCNYRHEPVSALNTLCLNYRVNIYNKLEIIAGSSESYFQIGDSFADFIPIMAESVNTKTLIFIASSNCLRTGGNTNENCIAIASYLFQDKIQEISSTFKQLEYNVRYKAKQFVNFKAAFKADTFVYFLFSVNSTHSKLGKMCTFFNESSKFNSYEDIPIQCKHSGKLYTAAMDAVFWSEQNYLFVTFSDDFTSVVCRYELQNIQRQFMEARKYRLKCPFNDNNKYFEIQHFPSTAFCYNTTSNTCEDIDKSKPIDCPEVTDKKNGFCSTQFFGSVEGQLPLVSDNVIYSKEHSDTGHIVKLAAITQKTYALIYAGTNTGKLGKIFAHKTVYEETLENIETIDNSFPILDIKISGENVYAMTENLVVKVGYTEACPTSGGCKGCMESENPFCGWDVLQNKCNKNNSHLFWVPSAGRKCLKLIPKDVRVSDGSGSSSDDMVNFIIDPDVFIPTDRTTSCKIKEHEEFVVNNYTCGPFVLKESGFTNMALMYQNTSVVNATLYVYNCSDFKSCTECVRGRLCLWCPKEFSCLTNAHGCSGAVNNNGESMCPRIDNSKSLFITKNSKENVTMYVPQFAVYNESSEHNLFRCVVNTDKSNMAAKYNIAAKGDNVICINVNIENNAVISLEYNMSYRLDNIATVEVYQCQSLNAGKKCGYCKYLRSQNYKCDWCGTKCESTLPNNYLDTCVDKCNEDIGTNLKVSPPSGPDNGSTVITITGDNLGNQGDNISVKIYGVECTPVKVIEPSSKINCTTGKQSFTENNDLSISVNGQKNTYLARDYYTYEKLNEKGLIFKPNKSIQSGRRKVFITGYNSYFNNADDSRFNVSFCDNNNSCIGCRGVESEGGETITCKMDKSDQAMELTQLKVIVDTNTTIELQKSFNIVKNPTINDLSPESDKVFRSGGSKITITGQGFSNIDEVTMEKVVTPCNITSDTSVICATPPYVKSKYERRRRATGQHVQIKYDDYPTLSKIYYVDDPSINDFLNIIDYTAGSSIVITGQNLLEGAKKDDYIVHIGLTGQCFVEDINSENITCQPPSAVPRTNHSDENIVYVLVQVGLIRRHVGFLRYSTKVDGPLTIILISVLSAVVAGAIFMVSAVIFIMRRKKKIAEKNFQMELLTREETIRQASREEFADAQMTIRDIKSDLVTSRVPFFDYQTYVFNQLFPNQDINKHPLLQEPMSTDDSKYRVTEALVMFDKLMTNKLFLKSVVQTLENQKGLSMQDKAHFACTLSVAFLGNMRLFYELVSCLLSDMIQSAPKKQHKVLFRRFDSITQRLMVNWLELSLYDHLKKQSGMQLFMLYKATQTVIEKGPIDAVTNHCRNTLAEERLLKNRVECETLTLNIDLNGNSDNHYPVTVLDCDTITQVKHKCITAIYKNKPASEIPTPNELELEWHHGRSGKLILQDKDKISDRSNGMVRLNTLKHYLVKNGSEMALMYKELLEDEPELYENQIVANAQFSSPDYVKLLIPDSLDEKNQDLHQWHLSNLTDEEKSQDYEIGELFLNRLFHTKLILRDYIDVAFEGILDPESLSVPVQYFLCMIDKQAKAVGVDSTVVQSWKSECYATRVWASLISRPQILFDVVVPSHVEPCMDILKQVFIDIFTQDAQNVSKDSSTQKLLFFKDVPEYRKHVDLFFSRVKGVSDQEFWRAIDEISSVQSREIKFNRQATLHQLYNIVAKYKDEIIEGFGANDETKDLDFGNKLEKVSEKMEE